MSPFHESSSARISLQTKLPSPTYLTRWQPSFQLTLGCPSPACGPGLHDCAPQCIQPHVKALTSFSSALFRLGSQHKSSSSKEGNNTKKMSNHCRKPNHAPNVQNYGVFIQTKTDSNHLSLSASPYRECYLRSSTAISPAKHECRFSRALMVKCKRGTRQSSPTTPDNAFHAASFSFTGTV